MAFAGVVLACFAFLSLQNVYAQGNITNLPNTIDVPENFVGIVYIVYSDAADTFTVAATAGSNCSLQADADCGTSGTTCTLNYDGLNTPDFEALTPPEENCEVTATASGDVKELVINVLDADDESPDTNCPVASNVDENDDSVNGSVIITCTDDNSITAFPVKYELSVSPSSAASKFVINEDTGVVSWAPAPLGNNFEVIPEYNLTITAYTPRQRDPNGHTVTITVDDVNEPAVITNLPQVVYIEEFYPRYTTSAPVVDTDLLTLTVYDEDDDDGGTAQTHTGSIVDNSCTGTDNWFKFEASAGGNTLNLSTDAVNAMFDYESTCREFLLSIVVEDNGVQVATSQTSTLTLRVLDIPEVPWFNEFDSIAPGDSDINTAFEVSFSYPDQTPTPSTFVFSESKGIGIFQNLGSSPAPAANTDGVYIADLNDYHVAREYYDPDCSPAVDGVTGLPACSATFQFKNPSLMEPFFEIQQDGVTGDYYLYQVNQIDYETLCKSQNWTSNFHQFEMNVVGVDSSGLETTNTVTLSMQLNDANEFIPIMDATHNFNVNENAPFDTLVGDMTCEDLNDCFQDDIDRFTILANSPTADNDGDYYFKVGLLSSNTGRLQVLRSPDYELVQQLQFDVTCFDRNTNVGDERTAVTLVTVSIIDQNDNEPELQETFFSLATRYDTEYRSYLTTLSATDLDSGLNAVPIFSLGAYSDEFGIDSDTGDVFTQGQTLLPFSTYIIYGVVYDTGEPGQVQNIGKKMATIRIDTFDASAVLVDLYLGIDFASFNRDQFIMALEDLMHPYKFFIYELNGYVLKEDVVSNGVRVSVYALENDVTLTETGLNQTKVFVHTEELLAAFREYADGTPSELFQSPQIISFGVRHVEATPISSDFGIEGEDESESWMVDTPEGNVVLALIVLLALFVLIGIVFAFYNFMRRLDCYRPSGEPNTFFPVREADNKLHVGKINKSSITALAREERQVTAPTLDGPPPDPPVKPQLQPVIASNPEPKVTTVASREGGRKIWEIKRSRELDGSANPLG